MNHFNVESSVESRKIRFQIDPDLKRLTKIDQIEMKITYQMYFMRM